MLANLTISAAIRRESELSIWAVVSSNTSHPRIGVTRGRGKGKAHGAGGRAPDYSYKSSFFRIAYLLQYLESELDEERNSVHINFLNVENTLYALPLEKVRALVGGGGDFDIFISYPVQNKIIP